MNQKHRGNSLKNSLRTVTFFYKRYPARSVTVVICLIFSGLMSGVTILALIPLLDRIMGMADAGDSMFSQWVNRFFEVLNITPTFPMLLIIILVGFSFKSLLAWVAMYHVGNTVALAAKDLRLDLIRALVQARWGYFVNQASGGFANAMGQEAHKASVAYQSVANITAFSIHVIISVVLAFLLFWPTALAGCIGGVVLMLLLNRFIALSRKMGKQQVGLVKSVSNKIVDILYGLKPLKAMSRESALLKKLETMTEELNTAQRTKVIAEATVSATQEFCLGMAIIAGFLFVHNYEIMSFPEALVQGYLFARIFNQMNELVRKYQKFAVDEASLDSIRQRTEGIIESQTPSGTGQAPRRITEGIFLKEIEFNYGDKVLFQRVSIDIPAGSLTALVGPSGSGKTTLSDLAVSLAVPLAGQVLVDDINLNDIDKTSWRRQIGYVPQELLLLHDSILANITLGEEDITESDAELALKQAGAWTFVSRLPEGINTLAGERGAMLSGGQRQRIALARALVRKPIFLVLDEATASLDPQTEQEICSTLSSLRGRVTILAISHQPAIAQIADLVYKVHNGSVEMIENIRIEGGIE